MEYEGFEIPDDLYYHKEHTWARVEGDSATFGVTDFAQHQAGDVLHIEFLDEGDEVEQDKPYGTIETGKWVGKLYVLLSGEIVEVNEELEDNARLINRDPYGDGWNIKVEPSDLGELDNLMKAEEYVEVMKTRIERLKKKKVYKPKE